MKTFVELVNKISLPASQFELLEKERLVIVELGIKPIQAINMLAVRVSIKVIEPFTLPTAITAS